MIYQFIPYFMELEMLNLQFIINYNIVDKFIILESNTTFSGLPKEYNFKKHSSFFEKFLDKVIYVQIKTDKNNLHDLPEIKNWNPPFILNWRREFKQKEAFFKNYNFNDDDIIIHSDVDEIVFLNDVINKIDKTTLNYFNIKHCRYYVNTQIKIGETLSRRVPCFTYKTYLEKYKTFHMENNISIKDVGTCLNDFIEHHDCGYHLSACYDIKEKIQSFSHGEYNNDECYNHCIQQRLSFTKNNVIDIPKIILENIDSKFIYS